MERIEPLSNIVDDLYAGTLDALAWDRAILAIADRVRAEGAMFFAFNPMNGAVLRDENHRIDPQIVRDYARFWTYEDIRFTHFATTPLQQPVTEDTLGITDFRRSRIYNEFLVPVDMPHFMPTWLHKSQRKLVGLSILGSSRRGPFEPQDIEAIRPLLPHLTRALEIRDRLEAAEIRATSTAEILHATHFGVAVLDTERRIIEVNACAEELLVQENWLHLEKNGVLKLKPPLSERLAGALRDVDAGSASADTLVHIPRDGKRPVSVRVAPLGQLRPAWVTAADPAYVVLLFDPERRAALDERLVAKDLGLTERESQVAVLLAAGLTTAEIAVRLRTTIHTVRTHMKSSFQKTGAHSQAELVTRLHLGPGPVSIARLLK